MADFSHLIYGYTKKVPTKYGLQQYLNFDNAASTPPFKGVMERVAAEGLWYSGVHRGTGYKSQYTTERYEEARSLIGGFVKADLEHDAVIFTKNTTESINKVRHYLPFLPGELVIYTGMEHHSNELPWLSCRRICAGLKNGILDLEQLEYLLRINRGKIKLLAVTGASNVTGYLPPIHILAEMAHQAGARILVDAAQLVPHRPVEMLPIHDPRHLDFLVFSGHKMYAPFGSGVLIGPKWLFSQGEPSQVGGGTIKAIGPAGVIWADPPDIEEAGSPNVLGALAIAESCRIIDEIGWAQLIEHEQELLKAALTGLQTIPGIIIYNDSIMHRVGVISFNIKGINHQRVGKFLAELGIGVRTGCFCARNYVRSLLNLRPEYYYQTDSDALPGMVRISFGCYNKLEEVKRFIEALALMVEKVSL